MMSASKSHMSKYFPPSASVDSLEATKFEQNSKERNKKSQHQRQSDPLGSSTAFQSFIMDGMEIDKLPAYVKQNETSLTFPEKVSDENRLICVCVCRFQNGHLQRRMTPTAL